MPFIRLCSDLKDTLLGVWAIEEDELFFLERVKLYDNEWARLARITHTQKRLEWLSSRLCMKELLKIQNHTRVESLNAPSGKPYLTNDPHFISYSHSTHYSAAIASTTQDVGVDIEYLGRKRNMRTRFLFMNDAELTSFAANESFELFILAWSAKETVYKLMGRGCGFKEHIDLDLQNVALNRNGILHGTVNMGEIPVPVSVYFTLAESYVLTYAVSPVLDPIVTAPV